jgi:transcriptional antiterminator RfaH
MSRFEPFADDGLNWRLLYTRPRAEAWVEANLRNQGFACLLPRTRSRAGLGPLFPRYVFAGYRNGHRAESLAGTYGVQYVVRCGASPATVPPSVIQEIAGRMDEWGVVHVESLAGADPIFAKRQRERVYALVRLAEAGFRVRVA